jgi:hypothetical protein
VESPSKGLVAACLMVSRLSLSLPLAQAQPTTLPEDSVARTSQEPPSNWKLLATAKLRAHLFRGCPGQPSAAGKLLAIPILNTSVMVYGP